MKSAGKARNNGLYRHIRTSKEIIRNLLNDYIKYYSCCNRCGANIIFALHFFNVKIKIIIVSHYVSPFI